MRAWVVESPGAVAGGPLRMVRQAVPRPAGDELLVRVEVCAVCRTDLHLAEGDLTPRRPRTVPGHEVVGRVVARGGAAGPGAPAVGERVGIAWLRGTCGRCRYCLRGAENLCTLSRYTGWDADGGFAEYATVPAGYAYPLPDIGDPSRLAPLLCAGIIGHRALDRAWPSWATPATAGTTAGRAAGGGATDGAGARVRLGVYGFVASAHLTAQVALARGATVHVVTRSAAARDLALRLGAASAVDTSTTPPEPLDAAILFAPAGGLVPVALEALDAGGALTIAGIHLSDVPVLSYDRHLFREREVRSVTANTRADGRALLAFDAAHPLSVTTTPYPFAEADRALRDLAGGRVRGAAVLRME